MHKITKSMLLGLSCGIWLGTILWMYSHREPIHTIWYVVSIINTILLASEEIQEEIRKRK